MQKPLNLIDYVNAVIKTNLILSNQLTMLLYFIFKKWNNHCDFNFYIFFLCGTCTNINGNLVLTKFKIHRELFSFSCILHYCYSLFYSILSNICTATSLSCSVTLPTMHSVLMLYNTDRAGHNSFFFQHTDSYFCTFLHITNSITSGTNVQSVFCNSSTWWILSAVILRLCK